jgi:hypothetical protein
MTSSTPTFCNQCRHVYRVNRYDEPYRWLCLRHRCLPGFGWVANQAWESNAPYLRCERVNGGMCPLFDAAPVPAPNKEETENVW